MTPSAGQPLVSVVIPTYNYSQFITQAVDSVLAQTYPAVEVIVVDDGSTDDTRARLAHYGDRIRYIYQDNAGVSAARNTGIRAATADLIAFLDADDVFHPRRLEVQVPYMLAHPEVGLLAAEHLPEPGPHWYDLPEPLPVDPIPLEMLAAKPRFGTCGVIARRECFDAVGGFDAELRYSEDLDMWLRIASRYPVRKVRIPLFWCRLHAGSCSAQAPVGMETAEARVLDRAFALPALRRRWLLRRRARSIATFAAALMYRSAGRNGRAIHRAVRSFWLWPFPHRTADMPAFRRLKFLCLMPGRLLRGKGRRE